MTQLYLFLGQIGQRLIPVDDHLPSVDNVVGAGVYQAADVAL